MSENICVVSDEWDEGIFRGKAPRIKIQHAWDICFWYESIRENWQGSW